MLIFRKSWRTLFSCYFRSKFLITEEFSFNPGSALSSLPSHDAWIVSNTLKMTFLNCFLSEQVSTTVFFSHYSEQACMTVIAQRRGLSILNVCKIFPKTNISYPLMCVVLHIYEMDDTKGLHRTFFVLISKDRLISFYLTENQDKQT